MTGERTIEVPEDFASIGYSGLLHTEATLDDTSTESIIRWQAKVPCLLDTPDWMALSVTDDGVVTLVRRDMAAVADVCLRPGPLGVVT